MIYINKSKNVGQTKTSDLADLLCSVGTYVQFDSWQNNVKLTSHFLTCLTVDSFAVTFRIEVATRCLMGQLIR